MNRIAVRSKDLKTSRIDVGVGDNKPKKERTSDNVRLGVVRAVMMDVTARAAIVTTVTARIRIRITEGESRLRDGSGRESGLR